MPDDRRAIQGLWRLLSIVARGGPVGTSVTHYLFDGDRLKQIDPARVDGGSWDVFALEPRRRPKRMTVTSEFPRQNGEVVRRVDRLLYDLVGDRLRICWPSVFGDYPDVLSDQTHGVYTLARDHGPPPATKRPSGKRPIDHPDLGRLAWDDDLDRWEGRFDLAPGHRVELSVEPDDEAGGDPVAAAAAFVVWLRAAEPAARAHAAAELLEGHNDNWNDGEPITAEAFAARLRLDAAAVDPDGGGQLYYADGDLFCGHAVIVPIDQDRALGEPHIAG